MHHFAKGVPLSAHDGDTDGGTLPEIVMVDLGDAHLEP